MKVSNKIFLVIPAFNEEKHIKNVVTDAARYCANIVVVDDGSSDNTKRIIESLPVTSVYLPTNVGKGRALKFGVELAISKGADKIITIDADGQHNIKHLPKFIKALDDYEVAIGVRYGHHPIPFVRKLGNRTASLLVAILYQIYVKDLLCGFRGFRREVYPKIKWQSSRYGIETEMIARIGKNRLKYTEIQIENIYIDQFKGVTLLDAIEVFLSIPKFKFN